MLNDPMRIRGQPMLTPEERAKVEALAEATGRPLKFCRTALIEANWDEPKARELIEDPAFVSRNTDFDLGKLMGLMSKPDDLVGYITQQKAVHEGKSDEEAAAESAAKMAEINTFREEELERDKEIAAFKQRTTGKTLTDVVFGELTFDLGWEGHIDVPGLGEGTEVSVEIDPASPDAHEPTEAQREAMRKLLANATSLRDEIERATVAHYEEMKENFRLTMFDEDDIAENVPDLDQPSDIWPLLLDEPPALRVAFPAPGDPVWITIGFACTWDEEHGHEVYVMDGKLGTPGIS
ncbi:MAG: hypothetical protein AAF078_08165 [Planctomycetota bacterium]